MRTTKPTDAIPLADVAAVTAIVWVLAATLHEGLGHGLACALGGGDPIRWTTFHFECGRGTMTTSAWRAMSAAGTGVNLLLAACGYALWSIRGGPWTALVGWTATVLNGLTSFGYLVFSAAFGIGDWNGAGAMAGVGGGSARFLALGAIGGLGYYGIVRLGARMLSRMPEWAPDLGRARRLCLTVLGTTALVSLLAGVAAGSGWRTTLGASLGVALGGNAGLFSVARLTDPSGEVRSSFQTSGRAFRIVSVLATVAFVTILGPSVSL